METISVIHLIISTNTANMFPLEYLSSNKSMYTASFDMQQEDSEIQASTYTHTQTVVSTKRTKMAE